MKISWKKIALSAMGLCAGALAILYWQVDARSQVDAARRVDAIIVLGAAVWQGERASPALNARVQHAIELYKSGYAAHLILSGGLGANPPSEAEMMRRIAISAGVPADALILEDQSYSTDENLANAKRLMDARGWRTALIVSDPFHIYRAEIIARDLGIAAYGSGARNSPTYTLLFNRVWYTARESIALVWYFSTRTFGEPVWLYAWLKERQQTNN
ncbi:MAG: YdcF family protein [Chloroflexi bacterium]|nr:YdcF family protein [Chloroflexota bacterium]